ncbi:sensor histidine kinase [Azohydromonas aeria]|uniref:sensor histidine kinase n=1 Tax=Azohydromonas aeria TaxID=2590212 RepID=UPI0018E028EB|nr:PAS domain S-box protein [Azohydromonas aeria]
MASSTSHDDLSRTEAWYRTTFEHAAVGIAHVALNGRFMAVNDRFCAIVAHSREALLHGGFQRITHPADLAQDEANVAALLAGRIEYYVMEKRYVRGDGSTVWVELTVGLARAPSGSPDHFVSIVQDISSRKALEAARAEAAREREAALQRLRESEAQARHTATVLEEVIETIPDPIWTKDPQVRWTLLNSAAAALIGQPRQALQGRRWSDVSSAPSIHEAEREDMRVLRGGERIEMEKAFFDASHGETRHFISVKIPMRASDGRITGMLGVARDITERRAAREQLRIAAVAFEAQEGLTIADASMTMLRVNKALCDLTGYCQEELAGCHVSTLIPDEPKVLAHAAGMEAIEHDGHWQGEVWSRRKDGTRFQAWISVTTVKEDSGAATHYVVSLTDISQRKRSEAELLQSQLDLSRLTQRLMEQEQATTRHLAQLLHDGLGQTISALQLQLDALDAAGMLQHLPASLLPRAAAVRELARQATAEVRSALVELRPALLEDEGLVAALIHHLDRLGHDAKAVTLTMTAAPGLQSLRWARDVEYAFFMVAREALSNALLHSEARRIECSLGGAAHWLRLLVRDDGTGMPDEPRRPGHLGIVGMRERAFAINARFEVKGRPGKGTCIELEWEQEDDDADLSGG